MQRLEVSDVVRPVYGSLGMKRLIVLGKQNKLWHSSLSVSHHAITSALSYSKLIHSVMILF